MRQLHDEVLIELMVRVIEVKIVINSSHDVRIQAQVETPGHGLDEETHCLLLSPDEYMTMFLQPLH